MDTMIAISYIKSAMIILKEDNIEITIESLSEKLDEILNKRKNTIIAYAKIALNNINNSANEVTFSEIEKQVECINKLYPKDKLIEVAQKL